MNYETASDFEINKAVAEIVYGKYNVEDDSIKKCDGMYCYDVDTEKYVDFAPCSDPSDAWPVIVDNKINIDFQDGSWPRAEYCEYLHTDKNPLRAAMIVFLMMQEHKELDK